MKKRPGGTVKLSVSIGQHDLQLLKRRAKLATGGNISAAITEVIRIAREWEGRETLAAWLGEGRKEPSVQTMAAVRGEWRGTRPNKKRTRAA